MIAGDLAANCQIGHHYANHGKGRLLLRGTMLHRRSVSASPLSDVVTEPLICSVMLQLYIMPPKTKNTAMKGSTNLSNRPPRKSNMKGIVTNALDLDDIHAVMNNDSEAGAR